MGNWVQIDGDIKQQYLPFKLGSGVQFFTFKSKTDMPGVTKGKLGICPKSFTDYLNNDICNLKLSESYSSSILNNLPSIQIREYLPDAKLDQVINFMQSVKDGFSSAQQEKEHSDELTVLKQEWDKKIEQNGGPSWNYAKIRALSNKMMSIFSNPGWYQSFTSQYANFNSSKATKEFVLSFPYVMYYKLMSCTTTNVYELPFSPKELYKSMGQNGWDINSKYGFAGTSNNSFLGKIINTIAPNIAVNCSPVWKPGSYDNFEVNISFDLFNDNFESAKTNFIFVNTILPHNMWMQYHVYQHSPDLYDVKIEGFNRMYMCAGNFSCEARGVMRQPSNRLLAELQKGEASGTNIIKIPDVYHVTLNLKSLLPNNFNNYLFSFNNNGIVFDGKVEQESAYTGLISALQPKIQELKGYWGTTSMADDIRSIGAEIIVSNPSISQNAQNKGGGVNNSQTQNSDDDSDSDIPNNYFDANNSN